MNNSLNSGGGGATLGTSNGKQRGTLVLSNPTGNVSFTIEASTKRLYVVSGGTATGVQLSEYTQTEESALKQELVSDGYFTSNELENVTILNITGDSVGTVILDVSALGAVGTAIKIVHKKTDNTWETLYAGFIPDSKQVTVTLTEFSPITGASPILQQPALLGSWDTHITSNTKDACVDKIKVYIDGSYFGEVDYQ